jgi:hypothetical protein
MIAHNTRSNCLDARQFYYDFLYERIGSGIPEGILDHISRCPDCQNEIDNLKNLLESPATERSRRQNERHKAVIELLALHLGYVGERVRCGTVKHFIASLADPVLAIRVSTPITKHVEECPACQEDLRYLQDLQLSHRQLCRLGRLLAHRPSLDEISCSQAHPAIDPAASMAFQKTNGKQLKHLCTCRECRERLYQRREDIRRQLPRDKTVKSELPCDSLSTVDIFDFCVTYGVDPADKNFIESQERLARHLRSCPTCLARIQKIQENIYHIAERPDSWVVTCFSLPEKGEPAADNIEEPVYDGIIPAADELKLKRRIFAPYLKRYAKLAVAAAAVIIIYAVLPGAPPAQALGPELVRAIKAADNVYITRYDSGETEALEEKWVSRSLGVYLSRTGETFAFSSIPDRIRMIGNIQDDAIRKVDLTADDIADLRKMINGSLGIIPFNDLSDLPANSELTKSLDETAAGEGAVYELTLSKDLDFNKTRFSRWLFFVDAEKSLPHKVEIYGRSGADEDYEMRSQLAIEYPDEREIKAAIESAF